MFHGRVEIEKQDFRKESSKKGFGSTPTDVDSSVTLEGEDYGFKSKINV
jgi:hypothetical protein